MRTNSTLRRLAGGITVGLLAPLMVLLAPAPAQTAAPAVAACSLKPTGGTVTGVVWMGFVARSYNVRVPSGMTGSVPLLLSHHGLGSNAFFQEVATGWSGYADSKKFIVAYPAGSAWGQAWDFTSGSDDVAFVKKLVTQLKTKYCIDPDRLYAEGGSLGGYMTQRMLCDAEDVFAAGVSTISGELTVGGCSVNRAVPVGIVNVEKDPLFPTSPQSTDSRDAWLERNGCDQDDYATETNAYGLNARLYSSCDDGTEVLWRTYTGSSHAYPTGNAQQDFHDRVWTFLQANPMP